MYVYDKMILAILLLIINVLLYINTREPQELTDVREKYRTLREHLKETNNQEFKMLYREIPLTAHRYTYGYIGYILYIHGYIFAKPIYPWIYP